VDVWPRVPRHSQSVVTAMRVADNLWVVGDTCCAGQISMGDVANESTNLLGASGGAPRPQGKFHAPEHFRPQTHLAHHRASFSSVPFLTRAAVARGLQAVRMANPARSTSGARTPANVDQNQVDGTAGLKGPRFEHQILDKVKFCAFH
jgi:hypothetical protein